MSRQYTAMIVGGGIMGLLGAYEIVRSGGSVAIVEKCSIGNPMAGSSGLTRSLRSDYADATYAELARLSWDKWNVLGQELGEELVTRTGNLNLARRADVGTARYAESAAEWLRRSSQAPVVFAGERAVQERFPQFSGFDYGVLEADAGLGFASTAVACIRKALAESRKCAILENATTSEISLCGDGVMLKVRGRQLTAKRLIVAAGLGTPSVLAAIRGCSLRLPLRADRPAECLYYIPEDAAAYVAGVLPVFSCLDIGVYGHPVVVGRTPGVKIGRYHPPASVNKVFKAQGEDIGGFVRAYMPELAAVGSVQAVTGTDECSYDMTPDGGFAIGSFAAAPQVFVAAGFCGTGYKFAPVVAEIISDFAGGREPRYDISVFDPARFTV